MICETCKAEGKTSRVYDQGSRMTLLNCTPFYDEQGRHHYHDSNTSTAGYRCSNGHSWVVTSTGSCWCGWPNEQKPAPSTSINEATAKAHPEYNMPVARDASWTIPASMLDPATPPDHYTLDQVRVMLRAAITHSWSTHLWSRTRPIEERIDTLLAMFTPKEKP